MIITSLESELSKNPYPGRGIIAGCSDDGKFAVCAYWTMGRSKGSRNRIFAEDGDGLRTEAFDPSIVDGDPSLIIYPAVKVLGNRTIVTNGDQTCTIFDGLKNGLSFEESLRSRKYEHDEPNFTPRISCLLDISGGKLNYQFSILKSDSGNPCSTLRFAYSYENPQPGEGHLIHTYMTDGNPLPSFEGEPKKIRTEGGIDDFSERIWKSLNFENKVSLFVRFIDIASGKYQSRILNKNIRE